MCDFFDDFDDDFGNDDSFEDEYDEHTDREEPFTDDADLDGEPEKSESKDDFTAKDAFILGGAMGFAYEQGLKERQRRKRKRYSDDS